MPAFLVTQRGPEIGRRFELTDAQFSIGRGQDNDLMLSDALVSRYHAVIRCDGEDVAIIDLGSTNPLMVNDTVPEPGVPYRLQHRDVIAIGQSVFSFQNPPRTQLVMPPPSAPKPRTIVATMEHPTGSSSPATPAAATAAPLGDATPGHAATSPIAARDLPESAEPPAEPRTIVSRRPATRETLGEPSPTPAPDAPREPPAIVLRPPGREPGSAAPPPSDETPTCTPGAGTHI